MSSTEIPKIIKSRYFLILATFVGLASLLSFWILLTQTPFHYDMARDAYEAHSILYNKDFKIMGPGTDIIGLNHGVLWFYILVIPYFIAGQNPQLAVIFLFILSVVTIPTVWLLSYRLFKNSKLSFVATILYSFSPLVVFLGSWMSNPILCLYLTPLLMILLWEYVEKPNTKKAFIIGIIFGLLIQSQLANVVLLITIPIYYVYFKLRINIAQISGLVFGLFFSLFSYLLVEIKFHGRGILGGLEFLKSHHGSSVNLIDIPIKIFDFLKVTVLPFPILIVIILTLCICVLTILNFKKAKKQIVFLLIWLSNILVFTFFNTGVSTSSFVFIPSLAAGIIFISYIITAFIKNRIILYVIVAFIVSFQMSTVISWQKDEYHPAVIQKGDSLIRHRQVIDFTYVSSKNSPFTISTVTVPLYINTTWSYLYEFYGKPKYGYLPYWGGRSQIGYLGKLPEKPFATDLRYLIIESSVGIPTIYITKAIYEENRISNVLEEKIFGYFLVQKRKLHKGEKFVPIPNELRNSPILYE